MERKYLCNINEDESLHLQDNNQFVVHTLDINAPQEWFDVVVLKQEGYDKLKKQIAELQEKLHNTNEIIYNLREENCQLTDKLHRRNMQIAELKKKIALAYSMGVESTYSPAKGRARDKQIQKMIAEEKE